MDTKEIIFTKESVQELVKTFDDESNLAFRITESLESISDKLGLIANALIQLSDRHGSKTPGPF